MRRSILLLLFIILLASGCVSDTDDRPGWVHQVNWEGGEDPQIGALLWDQIYPYKSMEYDSVDIIQLNNGADFRVTGISNKSPYLDLYEFSYQNGNLIMTAYVLEVIPQEERNRAISIALRNPVIREATSGISEGPTVKRILPRTSEKFYKYKTLLSVTWQSIGISALVDVDTNNVVDTWQGE